jgi:hypothetical protein
MCNQIIAHRPTDVQPTRCTTVGDAGRSGAHGPRVYDAALLGQVEEWTGRRLRRGADVEDESGV